MTGRRRRWLSRLFEWTVWAGRDRLDADEELRRMRHMSYRTDTVGLGVRFTEYLRARLRRRWLRLRK